MNLKRALSCLLVFMMILSLCSFSAFATEEDSETVVLNGTFAGAEGAVMELSEASTYSTTLDIEAGSYEFNIKFGDDFYSYPGTIKDSTSSVSDSGFVFSADVNAKCTFVAVGGSYTFSFNTETLKLKVTAEGEDVPSAEDDKLTVNHGNGVSVAEVGDKLRYNVYLSADMPLADVQTALNFNSEKLSLVKVAEEALADNYPNLPEAVFNQDLQGVVTLNGTMVEGYDFTQEKILLTLEFAVLAGGETTLEFVVQEMTAANDTAYYNFSGKVSEGAVLREELKVISQPVKFEGCTITLGGQIGINFHVALSDNMVADESAKMVFTLPNGLTKAVSIGEAAIKDGNYVFTCQVAAKEMASAVKAQVVSSDEEGTVFEYSVKEYAEYILEKAEESATPDNEYVKAAPLVKAMLNYGAAAQILFDYNTANLANESLSIEDKALADADLSAFAFVLTGKEAGVSYYGSRLSLESETALKHYFFVEDEENIPEFTVNGEAVTATKVDGYYEVKIADILAQNLDEEIVVTAGGITLNYNAFSYGKLAMDTDNANLKNLIKALFAYNQAAKAY